MLQHDQKIKIELRPFLKQHKAYEYLRDSYTTYLLYGGGAGGGKSWLGCEWSITQCIQYPGVKGFIAREKLKILKQTTLITFFKVAKSLGLRRNYHFKYNQQDSYIEFWNGSRIDLLEVKFTPSDPMYEDLGSSEYTFGWLEEAGEIHFNAFDTLKSRIGRHMNDKYGLHRKLLITCNPKKNWLYTTFYLPWKNGTLPAGYAFLQSLHGDNIKNESSYSDALEDIRDKIKKQRLRDGIWEYDADPGTMFDYDAITDLWTNTIPETMDRYMTVDVAREGQDKTVLYFWQGYNIFRKEVYFKQGIDKTAQAIKTGARLYKIPYSHIIIDEDGVGGGVVDLCKGVQGFLNNSSPLENKDARHEYLEPQNFANLKCQCAYIMAKKTNNHEVCISIEDNDPEFREFFDQEMQTYRIKNPDDDMKSYALVPKPEIKSELGRSPDYGDAFIMRAFFTLQRSFKNRTKDEMEAEIRRQQQKKNFNKWGI